MKLPKISVILPVYNREKFLSQTLKSLFNQTYKNFEIIAVDDGSTDQSVKILLQEQKKDSRLKVFINPKNLGPAGTANRAFELSNGEFIARMDSDDLCLPERLELQINYLIENPSIDVVGSDFKYHRFFFPRTIRGPTQHWDIIVALLFNSALGNPTVMFRRESIKKIGYLFDPTYKIAEDYELWTRAAGYWTYSAIPKVLLKYRIHSGQISSTTSIFERTMVNTIREKYLKKLGIYLDEEYLSLHFKICSDGVSGLDKKKLLLLPNYRQLMLEGIKELPAKEALARYFQRYFSEEYYRCFFKKKCKKSILNLSIKPNREIRFKRKLSLVFQSFLLACKRCLNIAQKLQ